MILDVDPKVDYAFKHMLGREASRPILTNVLNAVLKRMPGNLVEEIELLNPFNPKETFDDKESIVDLKVRDQAGWHFNVEMQFFPFRAYEKRIVYYASKIHQQQLHTGENYLKMNPTISISFLNHVMFPQAADYHLHFRLLEETHRFPLTDDLQFHILELPKFTKSASELSGDLDIWLYFLRHAEKMDMDALPAALQKQPLVRRALEDLRMLTQNDIERERYEARRKALLDHNTYMEYAKQDGRVEGRIEGEKIGTIHAYERLLNRPQTPAEELASRSLDELTVLADQLLEQVLKQK